VKWYFAINEAGAGGEVGWHAKLAALSAFRRTNLEPTLLYTGRRCALTDWMNLHGIRVLNVRPPFEQRIAELCARGRYSTALLGHWLRSIVCLLESTDSFVLYTDCDVVFLSDPMLDGVHPSYFACAPEFRQENWNYGNTGVMVINVPALRADFDRFMAFALDMMERRGPQFTDQIAYNEFYRDAWDGWRHNSTGSRIGDQPRTSQSCTTMAQSLAHCARSSRDIGPGKAITADSSAAC